MDLLTVQETARELKVAPITIRRYIEDGRLPAVKVGRGVRVRKEAVDQLLTEVAPKKRRTAVALPKGQAFTEDDPLWKVVGIGRSGGEAVATNKHQHLAEALLAEYSIDDEA